MVFFAFVKTGTQTDVIHKSENIGKIEIGLNEFIYDPITEVYYCWNIVDLTELMGVDDIQIACYGGQLDKMELN